MLTAYIDESLRPPPDDDSVYAMGAVIIDSADHHSIQANLESLRLGKSRRLHWREETTTRQLSIAKEIAGIPMRGIVTVHLHKKETRTERARRRCLERLLIEPDQAGVTLALIESRSPDRDHADLLLLMGIRKARALSRDIVIMWQSSYEEPLLWAADAVVGATTWWLDGHPACFKLLGEKSA